MNLIKLSRLYLTVGGLLGYSSVNSIVNLKVPSSKGVSCGPNMTAFHNMILLSLGAPETPSKKNFVKNIKKEILSYLQVDLVAIF